MAARRVEYQTRAVQDESGPRVRIMIAKTTGRFRKF